MSQEKRVEQETQNDLTQHAMLVAWGLYAQQLDLVEKIKQVEIGQKTREHSPQSKVLEFLVAMLGGLAHLQDISRSAHPLDQDRVLAAAWGQPGWADYSGVSRTLQGLTAAEVEAIATVLQTVSQPFLASEAERALHVQGRLIYDGDLTGRPVSSTSCTYPEAAFGYMDDCVRLGYQAAVVSMTSPTYERLWLANQLHSGDTVSVSQAQTLVQAAEGRMQLRPRRRTELVACRLATAEAQVTTAAASERQSREQLQGLQVRQQETAATLIHWQQVVANLETAYSQSGRQLTAHCQLAQARRKVTTYRQRLPRVEKALHTAQRRWQRHRRAYDQTTAAVAALRLHLSQLCQDNAANPYPIQATFRLDGGFASRENIAWLIEMGYDIYTKASMAHLQSVLTARVTPDTVWQRVGANARLTAWAGTTLDDTFPYPVNVALAQYQAGETILHAVLLHYGDENVTQDLDGWFHPYNARQTIEAGIKEGKNIFQMHHLKVRSLPALRLQEYFAGFAANFVRFAARWLAQQQEPPVPSLPTTVKHLVLVSAHASAWVWRHGDAWLLIFTAQSLYAGLSLRFGNGPVQLPLPGMT